MTTEEREKNLFFFSRVFFSAPFPSVTVPEKKSFFFLQILIVISGRKKEEKKRTREGSSSGKKGEKVNDAMQLTQYVVREH